MAALLRRPWRGKTRGEHAVHESGDARDVDRCGARDQAENRRLGINVFSIDDLKVFRTTEGSTGHSLLVFGVEIALWPTAANKVGKRYRGSSKQPNGSWSGGARSSRTVHGQVARG